ncbi:MGMT family protein [Desulfovibrio sp. OttesenSCG-928-O18]|nr:MGMT family protein [Desulfovibrio sp. OttesenSCG-928-O18]
MNAKLSTKPGFFEQVYAVVARIPAGKVMTYGQISEVLNNICSARYVGYAMSSAPKSRNLPCHRVINKAGEMAGGDMFGGKANQRMMLESEGVEFKADGRVNLNASLFHP